MDNNNNQDYIVIGTAAQGMVRAFAARTTNLVDEARRRHGTYPTATAALGRVLTAGGLLSANLKGDDMLTLRVIGNGPLGAIVCSVDAGGNLRGYVQNPEVHLPGRGNKLDVGGAVGSNGFIYVSRDIGLKEPYTGSYPLVSGEIGEDLAAYFAKSEQIPTAVSLGVLVEPDGSVQAAGGFFIQVMPGADEEIAARLEDVLDCVMPVSNMIAAGRKPEEILTDILGMMQFNALETRPLAFRCRCSKKMLESILISLGTHELEDMIEKQGAAEIKCHFCAEIYHFEKNELENLLAEVKQPLDK
ncbi:MAG: Hsp33 family molecular chaperone HslO [Bacillota bacterium]